MTQEIIGFELAKQAGAKGAIAVAHEGKLYDLSRAWPAGTALSFVTKDTPEGLDILRHDAAHVMAQAVKELYPETQITIGPTIENGFYYDFYREEPFTPQDLKTIEDRMRKIVKRGDKFVREEWSRDKAIAFFEEEGEHFKVELIKDLPEDEVLSIYRQGDFLDLCRGPHLPSTQQLGTAFKLTRLAGAYWRGDSNRPMLQRIYGTCWATKEDLESHLTRLEEAAKRDHRRLGKEMDLFHFQEEAQGSVFWHPHGWLLYRLVETYIRHRLEEDYAEVSTPQLLSRKLWEASGHWEKFRESMITCEVAEQDKKEPMALKPMNCPGHIEIFKQGIKSYRDLPLRMAEFGSCTRFEPSGALFGLMRVRSFVQDDAHIFCTPAQVESETKRFCDLLRRVYKDFGFTDLEVRFADRPPVRAGEDAVWDAAEEALRAGSKAAGLDYKLNPGEGAFYGPKLEFVLKDALGRSWQCGTLQADFVLAQRLGATYVDADGEKKTPVLLHRAILGSMERFIGILIEHYGGKFPLWLAPVQVAVVPITNAFDSYAQEVEAVLKEAHIRTHLDTRSEKVGYKIRDLSLKKIPYLFVVGATEAEERTVSIRSLGQNSQETLALHAAADKLKQLSLPPYGSGRG